MLSHVSMISSRLRILSQLPSIRLACLLFFWRLVYTSASLYTPFHFRNRICVDCRPTFTRSCSLRCPSESSPHHETPLRPFLSLCIFQTCLTPGAVAATRQDAQNMVYGKTHNIERTASANGRRNSNSRRMKQRKVRLRKRRRSRPHNCGCRRVLPPPRYSDEF